MLNKLYTFLRLALHCVWTDLFFRLRQVLFLGFGNILPDLLTFAVLRPFLWRLAGVKIPIFGSCVIRKDVWIESPKNLEVASGVQFNRDVYISSNAPITIEEGVRIAPDVKLITISHDGQYFDKDVLLPIHIKKFSHIGAGAVVLGGSIVEEGVVLAPNAVLQGDTKAYGVYVGNPARMTSKRNFGTDAIPAEGSSL